jgi:hypothetical protein
MLIVPPLLHIPLTLPLLPLIHKFFRGVCLFIKVDVYIIQRKVFVKNKNY